MTDPVIAPIYAGPVVADRGYVVSERYVLPDPNYDPSYMVIRPTPSYRVPQYSYSYTPAYRGYAYDAYGYQYISAPTTCTVDFDGFRRCY